MDGGKDASTHRPDIATSQGAESAARAKPLRSAGDVSPESCPSVLSEVVGRYRDCSEFAHGGIGRILLARDAILDRDVALKELVGMGPAGTPITTTGDPADAGSSLVARFLQEARLTGQLQHPSIVPVYELGQREDGTLYYTMKLVRGSTLRDAIAQAGSLRERLELLPHFLDLCQAIAYAHSRGVIHRDIKPANVMLGEFGETVVLDWGLAKIKGEEDFAALDEGGQEEGDVLDDSGANGRLTRHGSRVGTPGYMSPEQARGDIDAVAEPSDVYALGATLYHLVTGKCPFEGEAAAILERARAGDTEPMRVAAPAAPPELAAICDRAMSIDSKDRYPSGKEFAREIQRFLAGGLIESYHYSPLDRLHRFLKRRWPLVATAMASLAILLGIGTASYIQVLRARDHEHAQRLATESANRGLVWENYAATLGVAQQSLRDEAYATARQLLQSCPVEHRRWEWGHLHRRGAPEVFSLRAGEARMIPGGPLRRAIFSPDGRSLLLDRSRTGVKSLFNLLTGETEAITEPCLGWSECTRFLPGGKPALAVSTGASAAKIINPFNGAVAATFDSGNAILGSLVATADGARVAGYVIDMSTADRSVVVWDCGTGAQVGSFPLKPFKIALHPDANPDDPYDAFGDSGPPGRVLGFLDGDKRLVCLDENLFVLDLETGDVGEAVRECVSRSAAFASETATAAVFESSAPHHLAVWDVRSRIRLSHVETPVSVGSLLAMSGDGRYLATVHGNAWRLWSSHTGEHIMTRKGHTDAIRSIAFSPNSACVVTVDAQELKVWPVSKPGDVTVQSLRTSLGEPSSLLLPASPPEATPVCVFAHGAQYLAEAGLAGQVRLWRVRELRPALSWKAHESRVRMLEFSRDDSVLATVAEDGTAKLWQTQTGMLLMDVPLGAGRVIHTAALAPKGDRLAVSLRASNAKSLGPSAIRVLDVQNGDLICEMAQRPESASFLTFARDGATLLAGLERKDGAGGLANAPCVASDTPNLWAMGGLGVPRDMLATSDSPYALVLTDMRQPALWNLASHREIWRLEHLRARHLAMCPTGERFAVASMAGTLTMHASEDGRQLLALGKGRGPLVFTPDGARLVCVRDAGHLITFHADDWKVAGEAQMFRQGLDELRDCLGLDT